MDSAKVSLRVDTLTIVEWATSTALEDEARLNPAFVEWRRRRGLRPPRRPQGGPASLRTHCPQGHPYDDANTYVSPQGWRACRTCNRDRSARLYVLSAERREYLARWAKERPS